MLLRKTAGKTPPAHKFSYLMYRPDYYTSRKKVHNKKISYHLKFKWH